MTTNFNFISAQIIYINIWINKHNVWIKSNFKFEYISNNLDANNKTFYTFYLDAPVDEIPENNLISIIRWFKCLVFGHLSKSCNSQVHCSSCSGNHKHTECNNHSIKICINCKNYNEKVQNPNHKVSENHDAFSKSCKKYLIIKQ
jgi:hypothetical protein